MTIRLDDLRHRPIFDLATATSIGRAEHLVIDVDQRTIVALAVGKVEGDATILPWESIHSIGADAITVDDGDLLRAPETELEQRTVSGSLDPIAKTVLSDAGDEHGTLDDITINSDTGAITELVIGDRTVPGRALIGVGDYAAIVDASALSQ